MIIRGEITKLKCDALIFTSFFHCKSSLPQSLIFIHHTSCVMLCLQISSVNPRTLRYYKRGSFFVSVSDIVNSLFMHLKKTRNLTYILLCYNGAANVSTGNRSFIAGNYISVSKLLQSWYVCCYDMVSYIPNVI